MDMFYRIYIPYSKEFVLTTIKQTTQPLNIANQAYRKMFLSSYNEEKFSVQGVQTRLKRNDRFEISDRVVN